MSLKPGGSVKPVPGAIYYIQHQESGKYVHPEGAWATPGDMTPLCYFDAREDLALQFYFEASGNSTYLRHFNSNKYCAIEHSGVQSDSRIVIVDRSPESDDLIEVRIHDGRAYLAGPPGLNRYFTAREGENNPPNGSWLVIREGYAPSIAIKLVPVEEYTIISMKLGTPANEVGTVLQSLHSVQSNGGSVPWEYQFVVAYTQTLTNTAETSTTTEVGISVGTEITSDAVFTEIEVSFSFAFKFAQTTTQSTSTTTSITNENRYTYPIPPGKTADIWSTTRKQTGNFPFTAVLRSSTGKETTLNGTVKVEAFFQQEGFLREYNIGADPNSAPIQSIKFQGK